MRLTAGHFPNMGNTASIISSFGNLAKETRLLMIGLDAAGKTSILYKVRATVSIQPHL